MTIQKLHIQTGIFKTAYPNRVVAKFLFSGRIVILTMDGFPGLPFFNDDLEKAHSIGSGQKAQKNN